MDTIFALTTWLIPLLFGFRDTAAGKAFEGTSLAEATVVAATGWNSSRAHQERLAA